MTTQPPDRMEPVRHNPALDEFEGKWVAVKDGDVIACAKTSRELVWELRKMTDQRRAGAVAQFVRPPVQGIVTGVG